MRLVVHLEGIESHSLVTRQIAGFSSELPFMHNWLHSYLRSKLSSFRSKSFPFMPLAGLVLNIRKIIVVLVLMFMHMTLLYTTVTFCNFRSRAENLHYFLKLSQVWEPWLKDSVKMRQAIIFWKFCIKVLSYLLQLTFCVARHEVLAAKLSSNVMLQMFGKNLLALI